MGTALRLRQILHRPGTGGVQLFADPTAAISAFSGPLGLQGGSRNNLRGPHFSDTDLGLAKHFQIGERLVEFRADAFNVFNHLNFDLPGPAGSRGTADIADPSSFGVITGTAASRHCNLLCVSTSRLFGLQLIGRSSDRPFLLLSCP